MKHIDKYNKFIKLNEDIQIEGNIDEYDLNIIKDGLIELEDLGWEIVKINIFNQSGIYILLNINTTKIRHGVNYECEFDKESFDLEAECLFKHKEKKTYDLTKYEKVTINTMKEQAQLLLNMFDYDNGSVSIIGDFIKNGFRMNIILYKNETE